MHKMKTTALFALLAGAAFWVLDAALDTFVFHEGALGQTLFSDLSTSELYDRLAVVALCLLLAFGLRAAALRAHQAEKSFHAKESALLHAILEGPDCVIITRAHDGRILQANHRVTELMGYSREEIIGKTCVELGIRLSGSDREGFLEHVRGGVDSETFIAPLRFKDGQEHTCEISARQAACSGENCIISVVRDVEERLEAEKALRESEERYRNIFENAAEGIALTDVEEKYVFANPAHCHQMGLTPGELTGRSIREFVDEQTWAQVRRETEKRKNMQSSRYEVRIQHPNGEERLLQISARPRVDEDGRYLGTYGFIVDLTEQRRAERDLRESNIRYRALIENSPVGVMVHQGGRIVFANQASVDLHGVDTDSALVGHELHEFVHPDYRDLLESGLRQAVSGAVGKVRRVESRIITGQGAMRYLDVTSLDMDLDGERASLLLMLDTTQRRQAEDALRESRAMLETVLNAIPVRVFWKDKDLKYLGCNAPFARDAGLSSPDEVAGLTDYELVWKSNAERYRDDDRQVIERESPRLSFEEPRVLADEKKLWCRASKLPLRDSRNQIIGVLGVYEDITAQREADEALRESEERFRTVFEKSPVGIVLLNLEAEILVTNPALEHILGYGEDELREKGFVGVTHPDDYQRERDLFLDVREGTRPGYALEKRYIHRNGQIVWARVLVNKVGDLRSGESAVIGLIEDITERREAERALRDSEERYAAAQRAANIGSWDWDVVNNEITWSEQIEPMFGFGKERFDGTFSSFIGLVLPEDREKVEKAAAASLEENAEYNVEFRALREDGTIRWILASAEVMRSESGSPVRVVGIVQDISERKEAEAERRNLEAQIQHMQKLESLGVLAGGIAHDFNNILMAILGNADLALTELPKTSPARQCLEEIERASRRAADLCRQMLAYSGKGRFVVTSLDLNEAVREMAHLLEVSISKKAVLRYDLHSRLPLIQADATQIRQVVMNLITNASDAIGDDSGVITVRTGQMVCSPEYLSGTYVDDGLPGGRYSFVEVADTGCGMDTETLEKIFDPFFTTKFTGRGLGLAAVLGIIRGHSGALKVYSEPGKGTSFKILFPSTETPESKVEDTMLEKPPWQGEGRVLIADDEESILSLCKRMLERMGFEVATAENGARACEIFEEDQLGFMLVILDLTMPEMDGEETFKKMRSVRPDVRVILSSGFNEQEVTQRFAGRGLAGFIQKPYTLNALEEVIRGQFG